MTSSCCSGMSNSDRRIWKLTEQTMIQVRINLVQFRQCSNMTSMTTTRKSDQSKVWPLNTPGSTHIEEHTPTPENNTQGLGEQMHSSNKVTQRCPQTLASPTSKYQFFQTRETIPSTCSSKVSQLSDFTPRISRLGLVQI